MIRWIIAMNTRVDILFPFVSFLDAFELVKIPVESDSHDISTPASRPTEMHSKGLFTEYTKTQSLNYNAIACLSFDVLKVMKIQTSNLEVGLIFDCVCDEQYISQLSRNTTKSNQATVYINWIVLCFFTQLSMYTIPLTLP